MTGNPRGIDRPVRPYFLLFAGMAIFGSGTPVSKLVTGAFPVFVASGARMLLAACCLGALLFTGSKLPDRDSPRDTLEAISRADWIRLGAIAVAGMFLFSVFMLYGMKEISGVVGGIIMATTPAVTSAGAIIFLGDRIDRWKAIAIASAVAGVLIVNLAGSSEGSGNHLLLGAGLVFGAVCGEAAYTLVGKRLTADLSPVWISAIAASMALVLFLLPALMQLEATDWDAVSVSDWVALVWWGVGTMGLGSLLWYQGVKQVSATTASAFMGVMPVSAVLLSYLLLDESFDPAQPVGLVVVLAGIAAVVYSDRLAAKRRRAGGE